MTRHHLGRWVSVAALSISCMSLTSLGDEPVELGLVKWGRDLDAALVQAESSKKPVLLLFQEIPG